MSRQNKLRNKRAVRESIVFDHDEKGKKLARRKGPARTTPSHGKVNRWPYDKDAPQRRRG